MKKLLIVIALLMHVLFADAQLTLENYYQQHNHLEALYVENTGHRYLGADALRKTASLYEHDHTVFKTIAVPVIDSIATLRAGYASRYLFDKEDDVEVLVWGNTYHPVFGYHPFMMVLNEDGSVHTVVPYGIGGVVARMGADWKLIANVVDGVNVGTQVYSLPGVYSTAVGSGGGVPHSSVRVFPNPAQRGVLYVDVSLGDGRKDVLRVTDVNGRVVVSESVIVTGVYSVALKAGVYMVSIGDGDGVRAVVVE